MNKKQKRGRPNNQHQINTPWMSTCVFHFASWINHRHSHFQIVFFFLFFFFSISREKMWKKCASCPSISLRGVTAFFCVRRRCRYHSLRALCTLPLCHAKWERNMIQPHYVIINSFHIQRSRPLPLTAPTPILRLNIENGEWNIGWWDAWRQKWMNWIRSHLLVWWGGVIPFMLRAEAVNEISDKNELCPLLLMTFFWWIRTEWLGLACVGKRWTPESSAVALWWWRWWWWCAFILIFSCSKLVAIKLNYVHDEY